MTRTSAAPSNGATAGPALQQALAAAQAGRLQEACVIAEQALASGGDPVPLNALLGMLRTDLKDFDAAVRHLEVAHAARPSDLRIASNLAAALIQSEDLERALQVVSRELAFADPTLQLARIRGYLANQLGEFDLAIEALEHVLAAEPNDWESWNNLGNAKRGFGDLEGGVEAHRRSVELNELAAPSRLNYGKALAEARRLPEAEAEFRKMAADFPDDAKPLHQLHLLLRNQMRDADALEAIEGAISREPENPDFHVLKAGHFSAMHRMKDSEDAYRQVIAIDPGYAQAYVGLAVVHELTNSAEGLAALVKETDELDLPEDTLSFIRASNFRRAKKFDAGLEVFQQDPAEIDIPPRAHLLGQLLDGAGRYDEAFAAFTRMNEIFREDESMPEARADRYRNAISVFPNFLTEEWARSWREESAEDPRRAPVFLVGFPRSGTTLLDTILMSHPQVEVLEEEPAIKMAHDVVPDVALLPTATDEQIQAMRDEYFNFVATITPLKPGNLLIDKNPLTMNLLPSVRRAFPKAKIILALRHPCDVVLSCFMANFRLNDAMSNFIKLDTTAELYDASFKYYEHVQSLLPLATHAVVYENVVADRENELRKLFDFLELDWHDSVLDHQKTARERGRVKTASYAQVVEPIYTRSAGRWVNYRKHLEPVIPILEPWIRKFGYSTEG